MNKKKEITLLLFMFSFFSITHAACVSVDTGMMIERIGNLRILVKSSEKSIAILDIKEKRISTLTKKEQKIGRIIFYCQKQLKVIDSFQIKFVILAQKVLFL